MFRALEHQADLDAEPWRFDGRAVWFARCNCPVVFLPAKSAAERALCPDCARLDTTVPRPRS